MTPEVHVFTTPAGVVTFIPTATGLPIQTQLEVSENIGLIESYLVNCHYAEFVEFVAKLKEPIDPELYAEFGSMWNRARNLKKFSVRMILALLNVRDLEFSPDGKQVIVTTAQDLKSPKIFEVVEGNSIVPIQTMGITLPPTYRIIGEPTLIGVGQVVHVPKYRIVQIFETQDGS